MAVTKPTGGKWTCEDLSSLPDDGTRYEIIEGEPYILPSPTWDHQMIQMNLVRLLLPMDDRISAMLRVSPISIFISGIHLVEPDLLVVTQERQHLISERGFEGSPDLIIEILSPSNRAHDTQLKRELYARGGVTEYWIVDPDAKSIEVLVLKGEEYRTLVHAEGKTGVKSTVLPEVSFPAVDAFR